MQTKLVPQNSTEAGADRRQHPRYRFSIPLTIRSAGGASMQGMSIELSEGGLSAVTANPLKLTEIVELEPIADGKVSARVRRNIGRVYGFEFLNLAPEQTKRIAEACKKLPRHHGKVLTGLL